MKMWTRVVRSGGLLCVGIGLVWACGYDDTLRAYLDIRFWLPFSKHPGRFEKSNITRVSEPFAGMVKAADEMPLSKLRAAYQEISQPQTKPFDASPLRQAVAAATADPSLTSREREEVALIDAKIEMRLAQTGETELLQIIKEKLERFLQTARIPEFQSEARGWLAHVYFVLGDQTAAGKIYLDELNRNGSNLSRETLLDSLQMTYGYDGGPQLAEHLEEYFDTPEHAAFAIQLATNPHWNRYADRNGRWTGPAAAIQQSYVRINEALQRHGELLRSTEGANALALLGMRTSLRMGDPPSALKIAAMVPAGVPIREEADFNWMLASARFLSREYAAAERPLLSLFRSSGSTDNQKAAAAYGLCGVYQKTGNSVEQIRFALWLHTGVRQNPVNAPTGIEDQSVYWSASGFDLGMLLDAEASVADLKAFLDKYPTVPDVRIIRYSLAVRLARDNQYEEAAEIYDGIQAPRRAARMRELAELYRHATDPEGRYRMADFLRANPDRIYFNDVLWNGLQRYALISATDARLTGDEHRKMTAAERRLKDDQEERWRAYLMLRDIVREGENTDLGRNAAELALRCLRGISGERFERQDEIRKADIELSRLILRH